MWTPADPRQRGGPDFRSCLLRAPWGALVDGAGVERAVKFPSRVLTTVGFARRAQALGGTAYNGTLEVEGWPGRRWLMPPGSPHASCAPSGSVTQSWGGAIEDRSILHRTHSCSFERIFSRSEKWTVAQQFATLVTAEIRGRLEATRLVGLRRSLGRCPSGVGTRDFHIWTFLPGTV